MRKVVITRPAEQAGALAERVLALGGTPVIFPVIAISATGDRAPLERALAQLARYRLVVFVSPNAVAHALAGRSEPWPAQVPVAVMGPGSIAELARFGIAEPERRVFSPANEGEEGAPARFDSEALYAQLDHAALAGGTVLIIKGNGGRPWLAQRLAEDGLTVETVESYRRSVPEPDAGQRESLTGMVARGEMAQIVVTSSEGLDNLLVLTESMGGVAALEWLRACRMIVPHRRIAENATARGFHNTVLSGPGDLNIARALE